MSHCLLQRNDPRPLKFLMVREVCVKLTFEVFIFISIAAKPSRESHVAPSLSKSQQISSKSSSLKSTALSEKPKTAKSVAGSLGNSSVKKAHGGKFNVENKNSLESGVENFEHEGEDDDIVLRELDFIKSNRHSKVESEMSQSESAIQANAAQAGRYPSKKLSLKMQKENHKKQMAEASIKTLPKSDFNSELSVDEDGGASSGLDEDYSDLIFDGIVPKRASKQKTKSAKPGVDSWHNKQSCNEPTVEQVSVSVCSRCARVIDFSSANDGSKKSSGHRTLTPQSSSEKTDFMEDVHSDVGSYKWRFVPNDSDTESVTNFLTRKQKLFQSSALVNSNTSSPKRAPRLSQTEKGSREKAAVNRVFTKSVSSDKSARSSKGWIGSNLSSSDDGF